MRLLLFLVGRPPSLHRGRHERALLEHGEFQEFAPLPGAPVHLLPVRRTRAVPSDRKAFELLPDDDAYKIREKEAYNSFLRRKVHAMLVAMAAGAARYDFDYAFLLDYDTAVNVTGLRAWLRTA